MRKIDLIERQIRELSSAEFAQLREWMLAQDWAAWDAKIERDSRSGKLDGLVAEAKQDYEIGKSRGPAQERAGHAAAIYYSLVESCKVNTVNPLTYLTDVLERVRDKTVTIQTPDEFTTSNIATSADALFNNSVYARRRLSDGY